ncbi:MAG: hypothetical protein KAS96_05820 [Planctomycetes bacterium]|nr:hypothetical protein [Planctomycetota bacterium]
MKAVIAIIAGPLFLLAISAHLYIKLIMRKQYDSDLDDYYYEVEDQHPAIAKYEKWSKITFSAAVIAALLMFLMIVI